jgi:hypothetical protein
LGHRKLHRIDLEAQLHVAALGPHYLKTTRGPGASTFFHFRSELGLSPPRYAQKSESAAELRSAAAVLAHAN